MIRFLFLSLMLLLGCAGPTPVTKIDPMIVGEATFFPTIAAHTDAPIMGGNKIDVLLNGEQTFPAMLKAIRGARKSITYAQYLYQDGAIAYELAEAFAERCRAGLTVKLLLDSHGGGKIPKDIPQLLTDAGCQLEWFRRVRLFQFITPWELLNYNYRNHRRILVIDGTLGFTGGHGVAEEWTGDGRTDGKWRDTDVRVEGPIVQQMQAAFVESWRDTTGHILGGDLYFPALKPVGKVNAQIVKSSPLGGTYESYMLLLLSISSARKSIHLSNPYFLPDERMQEALLDAVKRGVSVVVLTPGKIDHKLVYWASRRGFEPLLLGGIQIYEYQAALMHAKTMVVDGVWAHVGTTNLDNRSFALNEEINLIAYDHAVAGELEKAFADDLKYSKKLTYEAWKARPWREKFLELFTIPLKEQL
ncbi:MAG: phospholipase D/Transphosphatidylase [Deltaproteobacteria bacterium]|jgi:cardiolipin synthase|nr:phospholipase D/Transphosphatidylase [Deltaproteobacteria bacterium]